MEPITGSWITIFAVITLFAAIIGLYFKGQDKRSIEARTMFGIAAIFGAIALLAWIGVVPGLDIQTAAPYTIEIPDDAGITTVITTDEQKLISSLSIMTIDAGSNKRNVCEDQVQYFAESEDPRLSTAYSIDTTTIASGVGTENGSYLKTNTLYKTIFHDTSGPSYYDGVLGEGVWNPSDAISAVAIKAPSTTSATVSTSITFGEDGTAALWKIATIPDMLDETATDGTINGQSSVTGNISSASAGEIQVGADDTPANDDTVYYNDTEGDGSFYLRLTFGSEGSQAYLKRPVVCFVNDMNNPCERNEFSAITAALYTGSGSDVVLPSDLHTAFSNMNACVEIGGQEIDGVAYIASGKTATYTVTFTVDEDSTDASADLCYMVADDLADYNGQDIRQGQGASTSASLKLGFRA